MLSIKRVLAAVCLGAAMLPTVVYGRDARSLLIPVMEQYFDLISAGNYEIAGDMWTPEALERSGRFDITYHDIVLKADCNSPVIRLAEQVANRTLTPLRNSQTLQDDAWFKLEYSDVYSSNLMKHYYYVEHRGDWFWLSYPQDFYAADWPVIESGYFRIHVHPDVRKYLNDVVLGEADRFVESMSKRLDIPDEARRRMAEAKIEYYYCPTDSVVEQITGFMVRGTVDLAANDIITADFPHFHEITHLLVNIRLRELPLYTLPVAREGLAVYLAGRWGKHSAVLMDLATDLYQQEFVTFDSIFTMSGFDTDSGAEIVYPVAGIFFGYLVDRLGMDRTLDLYLQLSGKFDYLNGLSATDVQGIIAGAAGHADWNALATDFDTYIRDYSENRRVAFPGSGAKGKKLVEKDGCLVRENGDWITFEFRGRVADSPVQGNLLFAPEAGLTGQVSSLFEQQYGDSLAYEGYRFGVRYDRNEIGLYDYAANLLVAKYIWGITPSEDYYDAEQNKVGVRFSKALFNGELPQKGKCRALPR